MPRRCDYFKDGFFPFIQFKGPCWGEDYLVRPNLYNGNNLVYKEMYCCQGHLQTYQRGEYTPMPKQIGVDCARSA